jgi:Ca2+-binding EF-hand superfamily protein
MPANSLEKVLTGPSMKRLGLICNFLPATLFLALAALGGSAARSQEVSAELLKALPPKPAAPPAPSPSVSEPATAVVKNAATAKDKKKSEAAARNETQPIRARLLEMFDKNKDGQLDETERAAAKKYAEEHGLRPGAPMRERMARTSRSADGMRTELRHRFDRDGNEKIDDSEMSALEQAMRPRLDSAPLLRQRYDKNGDGKIDEDEWKAARPQLQQWLNESAPR